MSNQNSKLANFKIIAKRYINFSFFIFHFKFDRAKRGNGFTLLETLVAVMVLAIGITASLALITQSLKSAFYFQNQTTAFYLAIEGIEFIKNWRDGNFLNGSDWLTDLTPACSPPNGCYVDAFAPFANQITFCGENCPLIKYNAATNNYSYYDLAAENTIFIRKITILDVVENSNEKKVVSEVSWQNRYGSQNFTLEEHIYNWR